MCYPIKFVNGNILELVTGLRYIELVKYLLRCSYHVNELTACSHWTVHLHLIDTLPLMLCIPDKMLRKI